ncbi:hypothetical protein HOY82DRAFT_602256 [Tuber indicum]|nr:hypothetical protein HOY82DRAFT_602256 [Tuber indicum]
MPQELLPIGLKPERHFDIWSKYGPYAPPEVHTTWLYTEPTIATIENAKAITKGRIKCKRTMQTLASSAVDTDTKTSSRTLTLSPRNKRLCKDISTTSSKDHPLTTSSNEELQASQMTQQPREAGSSKEGLPTTRKRGRPLGSKNKHSRKSM